MNLISILAEFNPNKTWRQTLIDVGNGTEEFTKSFFDYYDKHVATTIKQERKLAEIEAKRKVVDKLADLLIN